MDLTINLKFLSFNRTITVDRRWIQFLVIAAVLLASSVLSFWGSRNLFIMVVVLLVGTAVLIGLLKQPNYGFILIFISGMYVPFAGFLWAYLLKGRSPAEHRYWASLGFAALFLGALAAGLMIKSSSMAYISIQNKIVH